MIRPEVFLAKSSHYFNVQISPVTYGSSKPNIGPRGSPVGNSLWPCCSVSWPRRARCGRLPSLHRGTRAGVFFVTRLKANADIVRVKSRPVPKMGNVLHDEIIRLQPFVAGRPDLEDLRLVTIWLEDKQQELELLTNNFELAAATIAAIFKEHWQIELFFKLLKQHSRSKPSCTLCIVYHQKELNAFLMDLRLCEQLMKRHHLDQPPPQPI